MVKHILSLKEMDVKDIELILNTALKMKETIMSDNKNMNHLMGKTVVNLFYENSTRTSLSFELAAKYLGANSSSIAVATSSVKKGESFIDTVKTIDMMGADIIVIRHPLSGAPHLASKNVNASVINAGDGINEHPTQALLDIFTILEKKKEMKGLKVAIVGDIYHSRVARSNIWGMNKLGAEIKIAGPATLIPKEIEKLGVKVCSSVKEALEDADVVMGLRVQLERQKSGLFPSTKEYSKFFGINEENLKYAKEDALIMHPGPVNRGVEMSNGVIDSKNSFINEQVRNGVAIRMAILHLLTKGEG